MEMYLVKASLTLYYFLLGTLSWLDGSDVSYSNWVGEPLVGARCGYILQDSGFQWEATDNCTQEMLFVCEFG